MENQTGGTTASPDETTLEFRRTRQTQAPAPIIRDIQDGQQKRPVIQFTDPRNIPKGANVKKLVFDAGDEGAGFPELMAQLCEDNGRHQQAAAIRGQQYDASFMAEAGHIINDPLNLKKVLAVMVVGAAVWVVYEFVAAKFDWPRAGMFSSAEELAQDIKSSTRRAA